MEISINGQGKINDDLTINILTGYTYIHPISLTPKKVYGLIEEDIHLLLFQNHYPHQGLELQESTIMEHIF